MFASLPSLRKNRQGQSMVEYGILVGAIAIVCLAATAMFGHKANYLYAVAASMLPGAETEDNGVIFSGKLVKTTGSGTAADPIRLSNAPGDIGGNIGLGTEGAAALVTENFTGTGS